MPPSPTPAEAEEFAHTHMRGTRARDNVLNQTAACLCITSISAPNSHFIDAQLLMQA
jgi:hypothetical protein